MRRGTREALYQTHGGSSLFTHTLMPYVLAGVQRALLSTTLDSVREDCRL